MTEPELIEATVTCHTEGCQNEGVALQILCTETVVCGPCNLPIADVQPVESEGVEGA